jgi:P2 family phage contractile tail tube protein
MALNKIFNANCYVEGTTNLLGKFSELKLPDLQSVMHEHKGVGMFGTVELPAGLQVLKMSVKWNGFYPEVAKFSSNHYTARRIQVRANVEVYDATGRAAELPLVVTAAGRWTKAGGLTFKGQESSEIDDELTLTYIKTELDSVELYEVDVLANKYVVDGVDLLATMRANIGA